MHSSAELLRIAQRIIIWAEQRNFSGTDPYDGLNSRLLKPLLEHSRFMRLAVIQTVKRCPVNLRPLLMVPEGLNPKGLALFMSGLGHLKRFPLEKEDSEGTGPVTGERIRQLAEKLEQMILSLASRADGTPAFSEDRHIQTGITSYDIEWAGPVGWGYNFPWQSRAFLQPAWYPTVVCSSFVLDALHDTRSNLYPAVVKSLSRFTMEALNIHESDRGICFSYSPADNTRVYNASLFAAKILARASAEESDPMESARFRETALKACDYVKNSQGDNGSWVYGEADHWQWIDNLHTGFVLETLNSISGLLQVDDYRDCIEKGSDFYWNNLFEKDGTAKYYCKSRYPLDPHSFAQGAITLSRLNMQEEAEKVLSRGVDLLWDEDRGGFIFQKNRHISNRQIHLRWSQGWMLKALATVIQGEK